MSAGDVHGQRLSAIDSSFLRLESEHALMHIGWSAVFSVPLGAERPTVHALRTRAAARLHWVPRCRQRLCPSPLGGIGEPRWVDDTRFDLTEHLLTLPDPDRPVSQESFARVRDALLGEPLDRSRPLWQIMLIPRLEDGRVGILGRVHHAMADGTAALLIAGLLLDSAEVPAGQPPVWLPQSPPRAARWVADPFADSVRLTAGALAGGSRAVRSPRRSLREGLRGAGSLTAALREDVLARAHDCSLNTPNGPRRTLIGCRFPIDELRAVRTGGGGMLNDVALAMVSGALRSMAQRHGEPTHSLKAMIPVSVRLPHEHAQLGNRISQMLIRLPLHLEHPLDRLHAVREQTEHHKHTERAQAHQILAGGLGLLQGPARDALLRLVVSPRTYNLVVSNVRGPRTPLHLLGARLDELYPVVPIGHAHALAVGMFSHGEHLHVGLHADPDALPHVSELPDLLADELRTLTASAPGPDANPRARRPAGADHEPRTLRRHPPRTT
ncbi:wax ester/triacylglycerol synthase family O-acyltransferase [Paraconexibacter antarcticus]|uniref:Diacylglycerol O-acyltransferase n=1 Tax=Paraconexibacter antarcticus TaxID=2949664 RepID=A0ABY5E1L4_9ACTN|nr:wax ester/triacylglycerol synthase family O-acyltransferase [Paraconexibacter antarcticus]UTI66714.1 wax ester/triacylglycerol synthase family O-acyltransferase [Paraconexibacter antarcticus]